MNLQSCKISFPHAKSTEGLMVWHLDDRLCWFIKTSRLTGVISSVRKIKWKNDKGMLPVKACCFPLMSCSFKITALIWNLFEIGGCCVRNGTSHEATGGHKRTWISGKYLNRCLFTLVMNNDISETCELCLNTFVHASSKSVSWGMTCSCSAKQLWWVVISLWIGVVTYSSKKYFSMIRHIWELAEFTEKGCV